MDTIRLRTLARKSVFDAGKYEGYSVQQVLNLDKKRYLRHAYYCLSMISFLPDILDEIGITEEFRIGKPGTNEEMFEYVNHLAIMKMNGFLQLKRNGHNKKVAYGELKSKVNVRHYRETRGYLQAKNQGRL